MSSPRRERAAEMAHGIAGAQLVTVPHCGHLSTLERPRRSDAGARRMAADLKAPAVEPVTQRALLYAHPDAAGESVWSIAAQVQLTRRRHARRATTRCTATSRACA